MTIQDPSPGRTVLLRTAWQVDNLGDVAHVPGAIRALQKHGGAEVILWPLDLGTRERQLIAEIHPDVEIVDGEVSDSGLPTDSDVLAAWERADVFVHGPGASPMLGKEIDGWRAHTGKPYGYFGVTADPVCPPTLATLAEIDKMIDLLLEDYMDDELRERLEGAEFFYARDSLSLKYLRGQKLQGVRLEFGPDATFEFTHRDDDAAEAFLQRFGLTERQFGCFVPRVRYAPYPQMKRRHPTREQQRRAALNQVTCSEDLDAFAGIVTDWVRTTGTPAAVVPEMSYVHELALGHLPERLPEDVRDRVHVLDRYWPLEEMSGVYARAAVVVSMDCHSPIIAAAQGTPTFYVRLPTETTKGRMYADLGDPDMVVEIEDAPRAGQLAIAAYRDWDAASRRAVALAENADALLREVAVAVSRAPALT
ncbi:polysaccharide pyruvyl transferase WcaK-like protein [Haloactinopolyspora alba]|uniref:Polysaccharide pyruvyl transferase WcaK-like protein n=1 Tax=Haloactinopolyspora alba TaxID=648780 RepID=A0A2P8DZR6_9ACTN|nr:polysaccharide pyruvyl transferase family protein [Haloactinopolyspora alba]PSL02718.1 polysaccharide pyruvyl transferase WcaK-like protein [Haloactinopolyspora alba]